MANKEEGKSAAAVSYAGDSIQRKLFWVGLILVSGGLMKGCFSSGKSPESGMIICSGAAPELSPSSPLVKIGISQDCYTVVMIAPSVNSRVDIVPKKSAEVCFWNGSRCVAWMNIGYRKAPTVLTRKDIPKKNYPEYSSILIKGDPGETEVRLSR